MRGSHEHECVRGLAMLLALDLQLQTHIVCPLRELIGTYAEHSMSNVFVHLEGKQKDFVGTNAKKEK